MTVWRVSSRLALMSQTTVYDTGGSFNMDRMLRLVGYPVAVQLGLPLGDHTDPLAPFVPSAVEFYFVRHLDSPG